jgi:hypothetical protein
MKRYPIKEVGGLLNSIESGLSGERSKVELELPPVK